CARYHYGSSYYAMDYW
nr:immunoglobulin heavy chain junction region [Mus musculus]